MRAVGSSWKKVSWSPSVGSSSPDERFQPTRSHGAAGRPRELVADLERVGPGEVILAPPVARSGARPRRARRARRARARTTASAWRAGGVDADRAPVERAQRERAVVDLDRARRARRRSRDRRRAGRAGGASGKPFAVSARPATLTSSSSRLALTSKPPRVGWAAKAVAFHDGLVVGERARRRSCASRACSRTGRSAAPRSASASAPRACDRRERSRARRCTRTGQRSRRGRCAGASA